MLSRCSDFERLCAHYANLARHGPPKFDSLLFSRLHARQHRVVLEALALRGGESILDAGCGPGLFLKTLKARGHEVWAVDVVPEVIERAARWADWAGVADVQTLALGRTFHRVLCIGVLEWVEDLRSALARLVDHMAPGGRLVVLVPGRNTGGFMYKAIKGCLGLRPRLYSPAELQQSASAVGLRCLRYTRPFIHNFVCAFTGPLRGRRNEGE